MGSDLYASPPAETSTIKCEIKAFTTDISDEESTREPCPAYEALSYTWPGEPPLVPDYTKSADEIYVKVSSREITTTGSLKSLSIVSTYTTFKSDQSTSWHINYKSLKEFSPTVVIVGWRLSNAGVLELLNFQKRQYPVALDAFY